MTFKELLKTINKKEWLFVGILSLVMIIVTSFPYFYTNFIIPPQGKYFTGSFDTTGDATGYLAQINQAKNGHLLFKDLRTSEEQPNIIFNPLWFLVGWTARIFNLSPVLSFHLFRILLIPLVLAVIYLFTAYFFNIPEWRKITLLILALSNGALIISPLQLQVEEFAPLTFYSDNNLFLAMLRSPHFLLTLILMIFSFLLILLAFRNNKFSYTAYAGLMGLILFFLNPRLTPAIYGVLALYLLILFIIERKINWLNLRQFLIFLVISFPAVIYWLLITRYIEFWQIFSQTVSSITPDFILGVLSAFSLFFLGAILATIYLIKNKDKKYLFLIIWFLTISILIYLPFNSQRRVSFAWQIPIIILSVVAGKWLIEKLTIRQMPTFIIKLTLFFLCLAVSLTNLAFFADLTLALSQHQPPYFISQEEKQAIEWLGSQDNLIILASLESGMIIPALIDRQVYIGHEFDSDYFLAKVEKAKKFFSQDLNEQERIEFLKENNIGYIYYGELETSLGDFNSAEKDYLKEVYRNNEVKIYQVL